MATAAYPLAHAGEIKFQYGVPEVFGLKYLEPKTYEGKNGPRSMFTTVDDGYGERKIWVDYEDASNMVIEFRRLGINVGEPIRVMKIKHPRGGGHGYLVERAAQTPAADTVPAWVTQNPPEAPAAPPSRIEAQLAQSVQMVREHGPQVFQRPAAPAPVAAPTDSVLMAALKTAIDAVAEATAYAKRRGMELAFSAEDIRCCALSVYINAAKGGR